MQQQQADALTMEVPEYIMKLLQVCTNMKMQTYTFALLHGSPLATLTPSCLKSKFNNF